MNIRDRILEEILRDYPTLRLRPEDEHYVMKHIHEGAWTLGLEEDDLPGFEPEELYGRDGNYGRRR
jgi:hypothetical protein